MIRKLLVALIHFFDAWLPAVSARLALELYFRPQRYPRPVAELSFWNSGERLVLPSGCLARAYGRGSKIVWMVHGWESRGSRYEKMTAALVAAGYRVILWEGPAHGESPGARTNLAEFTHALRDDIGSLGTPLQALVGHSFGGGAAGYACALGVDTPKLVIIATPNHVRYVFEQFWNFIKLSANARQRFVDLAEAETQIKIDDVSSRFYLPKLLQKVMLVHDRLDKEIAFTESEFLARRQSSVEFLATEGLGHRRILADDEVIRQVVQFIS